VPGLDIPGLDVISLATDFGCIGVQADTADEIVEGVNTALHADLLTLVVVPTKAQLGRTGLSTDKPLRRYRDRARNTSGGLLSRRDRRRKGRDEPAEPI
jgi:hypothetical protein